MELFGNFFKIRITFILMLSLVSMTSANAAMVSTSELLQANNYFDSKHTLRTLLQRDVIQKELVAMGVEPDRVLARVESMSDSEIQLLAGTINDQNAGGNPLLLILLVTYVIYVIYAINNIRIIGF